MDKNTLLRFWALMGIERADEDHRTLRAMQPTPEVERLADTAAEAKRRHHVWLAEHHPDRVEQARLAP